MKIAGFNKNSFIDYPGHIAAVVFTAGCNMNCWYCHNRDIITGEGAEDFDTARDFLKTRRGMLDGVVFSGGEPTLQPGLIASIESVRELGFKVKLDTNGLECGIIGDILDKGIIDYIAMDIKAPFDKYKTAACIDVDTAGLKRSIGLIMSSGIDYEFRTTFMPQLDVEDIVNIAGEIRGAKLYAIQQYQFRNVNSQITGFRAHAHAPSILRDAADAVQDIVQKVIVRGV